MSWPAALRDRKLTLAIVILALVAALSQLLLWWLAPAPKTHDFIGPPRSGYTLTDFTLTSYGVEGKPAFKLKAPHLERRDGDESLYINSPAFVLPAKQPGVPDWHGHSLYGWVNQNGELLKLQGPVTMVRPAYADTAMTQLHSSDVTVWPKNNRLQTAAAAHMDQGALTMSGVGMRANLNDKHLELLNDFHATFPPRQKN